MLLLLLVLFEFALGWRRLRIVNVTSSSGDLVDEDVEIVINTEDLILAGSLRSDCLDIEFTLTDTGAGILPHFLEGGCNMSMTRFWVTLSLVPEAGVNVYMFYGSTSADEIGRSSIPWGGSFYTMQDGSTCGKMGTSMDWAVDRFPIGDATGGNTGGSSSHSHDAMGTTAAASGGEHDVSLLYFPMTERYHPHPFVGVGSSDPNLPPYRSVQFCESRYQIFEQNAIGIFRNISNFGVNWISSTDFDDRFPMARSGGVSVNAGSADHDHEMTFSTLFANESELLYTAMDAPNIWGTLDDHVHPDELLTLDLATSIPPYRYLSFGKLTAALGVAEEGMLIMATDLPPKGFEPVDWMFGYFPRAAPNSLVVNQTGGEMDHSHSFSGLFPACTVRFVKCETAGGSSPNEVSEDTHSHTFSDNTSIESLIPSFFTVRFATRKPKRTQANVEPSDVFICNGTLASDPSVCTNRLGECILPNYCNCTDGYGGLWCEQFACNGTAADDDLACNGFGECVGIDTCNCFGGANGTFCEEWNCSSISRTADGVCGGFGRCIAPDDCSCLPGYNGSDCESFYCFGVEKDDVGVCSGAGNCTAPDVCVCPPEYNGTDCEHWWCDGIHHANSSFVCSSYGACVSPNLCDCDPGYYDSVASDCAYWDCYSTRMDGNVCSDYGDCVAPDQCVCDDGYYSFDPIFQDCRDWNCTGGHSAVGCNMHGSCITPDECICFDGYYGDNCEFWDCYGVIMTDSGVCSEKGTCLEPDHCSCSQDQCAGVVPTCVYGINCDEVVWPGSWHASRRVLIPYVASYEIQNHPELVEIVAEEPTDGQQSSPGLLRRAIFDCASVVVDFETHFGSADGLCYFEIYGGLVLSLRIEDFSPHHNLANGTVVVLYLLEQNNYTTKDSQASVVLHRTYRDPPPPIKSNDVTMHVGALVGLILVLVLSIVAILVLFVVCLVICLRKSGANSIDIKPKEDESDVEMTQIHPSEPKKDKDTTTQSPFSDDVVHPEQTVSDEEKEEEERSDSPSEEGEGEGGSDSSVDGSSSSSSN